jgi:hypothetical protein
MHVERAATHAGFPQRERKRAETTMTKRDPGSSFKRSRSSRA